MEPILVRGHSCDGLIKHFEARDSICIPSFNEDGAIRGCDDTNYTYIDYCPYCGDQLPLPKPVASREEKPI
jgi:hypothetical protein